ncbi:MAG: radical SAM protein [Candidatus Margulisiibacteriota bacterium]
MQDNQCLPINKKILLINPLSNDLSDRYEIYPSGALILIGTILNDRGYNVKIIHMLADRVGMADINKLITDFQPAVVGITMNTFQTKSAREISRSVKQLDENIVTIVGGPHPSALKLRILEEFPDVDIVVVGEGEEAFLEVVENKKLNEIKGIGFRIYGEKRLNEPRPLANIDDLPLPNLDLIDLSRFKGAEPVGAYPTMFIMASRGCPFQCVYCNKSVFGNSVRFRDPKSIIKEIKWLHEKYGVKEIFFQDDTFNLDRKWCEEILDLIIINGLNKRIIFKAPFRANHNLVDEKLLNLVKKAGFRTIFYGVESGNQQMLDNMKKGLNLKEIKRAFALTHKAGLMTIGAFIIGLPGENRKTVEDTFNFWKELRPYHCGLSPAIPLPGTEFEEVVIKKGQLLADSYDDYSPSKFLVRTDELTKNELETLYKKTLARMAFIELWRHPVKLFHSLMKRLNKIRKKIKQ